MPSLPLAGSTFAWLHQEDLDAAIAHLRDAGVATFELQTVAPHVGVAGDARERQRIRGVVERSGLRALSVNPTFLDINLVSSDPVMREASVTRMLSEIELAAEIGAQFVVVIPGRRHALSPAPDELCRGWLRIAFDQLIDAAERYDVTLCMENNPYGYLGRSQEILEVLTEYRSPCLRSVYDVANALAIEDPGAGVKRLADHIALVHVSDTWRELWAHTSPGRGEVDFPAFAQALTEIGFRGFSVYELVDGEPVGERLAADLAALVDAGWELAARRTAQP